MRDVATNVLVDEGLGNAHSAMQHDLGPFVYVVLLWPIFLVEKLLDLRRWQGRVK